MRVRVRPSLAGAIALVVVALCATAFAVAGFVGTDGVIHGCVAQGNIVNPISDPVLSGVTGAVTPTGSLVIVAPGTSCPAGYTPLDFNQTGPPGPAGPSGTIVDTESSAARVRLGPTRRLVDSQELPVDTLVEATGHITVQAKGTLAADQLIDWSLVMPDGATVPGSAVAATLPAHEIDAQITLPIDATFLDVVPGAVGLDCRAVAQKSPGTKTTAVAAANLPIGGDGIEWRDDPRQVDPIASSCQKYIEKALDGTRRAREAGPTDLGVSANSYTESNIDTAQYHCGPQAASVTDNLKLARTANTQAYEVFRKGGRDVPRRFDEAEVKVKGYLEQALQGRQAVRRTGVPLAAVAAILVGAAWAAAGAAQDRAIHACVAQQNIVSPITDPLLSGVTQIVTPAGAVLVSAVCPQAYAPLSFNQTGPAGPPGPSGLTGVAAAESTASRTLGVKATAVVALALAGGSYVLRGVVVVAAPATLHAEQLVKCALETTGGKSITGSTSAATLPPGATASQVTIPLSGAIAAGTSVSIGCKDTAVSNAPGTASGASAATVKAMTAELEATPVASVARLAAPGPTCPAAIKPRDRLQRERVLANKSSAPTSSALAQNEKTVSRLADAARACVSQPTPVNTGLTTATDQVRQAAAENADEMGALALQHEARARMALGAAAKAAR